MGRSSRLKNSILNMGTTAIVFMLTMIMSMVVRMFLNRTLGQEYVGLNGVLTSVVTSFSLADLGVDSVFVYLLYQPLANRDTTQIGLLMQLFKKVYSVIGVIFIAVGLLAIPFLDVLLGKQAMTIPNVKLIYILFMFNSGLSYFFSYYRIILNADQKYYVIARITLIVTSLTNIMQIFFLLLTNSFTVYVSMLLISTVTINIFISFLAKSQFSFLKHSRIRQNKNEKVSKNTIKVLFQNTIGGFSNKVGSIIVFSSDNVLLANFVGLSTVGIYSNYTLITQGVSSFVSKIISSITATVGDLGTEKDKKRNFEVFLRLNFAMNFLVDIIALPMLLIFSFFIKVWVGKESVLPVSSVVLIVINAMLQLLRYPSLTFIDAFGLQWIQKWKSVLEAAVNLGVSLLLLVFFKLGLNGVLLGTFCSSIFVVSWYEPFIVLKEVCNAQYRSFMKQTLPFLGILLVEMLLGFVILQTAINGIYFFVTIIILSLFECLGVAFIFRKTDNFLYYFDLVKKLINSR